VDDLKKVLFSESNDPGDSMNKIVNIIIKDFEKKSEAEGKTLNPSPEAKNTVGVPYEP
jgi:hypothetical protein